MGSELELDGGRAAAEEVEPSERTMGMIEDEGGTSSVNEKDDFWKTQEGYDKAMEMYGDKPSWVKEPTMIFNPETQEYEKIAEKIKKSLKIWVFLMTLSVCLASMGMLTDNEQETIDALLRAGFQSDDIPAIMGNIDVETGGTYSHTQEERGGKGYGLFQFTGSHKRDYMDWLKKSDLDDGKNSQAKFVYDNIYGSKGYGRELGMER